ncbi:MAG: glutamate--tRNA ligase [Kiritimatiellae bacterium]|nr:glutamate--tRNA ligase [Kiritimatiellia bacterium]
METKEEIRARFAPSPTGKVHIGNIRAAIYNWLFARHTGGKFLLRVEDTDLERSTPEAIEALFECMKWLGLDWDEEVFYQTKNIQRHLECVEKLLSSGRAYKIEKTSRDGKTGIVTMFRMPKEGTIEFDDIVKGHMAKKAEDIQDFAIVRSDGSPIFHIANVVDDIDQRVTHIIRGDDHVENTFKHIEIFKALGAPVPRYAHLSMIVNRQGKPYSKRDGAAFVGEYRDAGYLPDALFNYLLLLGWNPGGDREVISRDEAAKLFDLEKVHVTAAMFDPKKLQWMNGEYIKRMPAAAFKEEVKKAAAGYGEANHTEEWWDSLSSQLQTRTKFLKDLHESVRPFFDGEYPFEQAAVEKRLAKPGVKELLLDLAARFESAPDWNAPALEAIVKELSQGGGMGPWVHPVRVATSGRGEGIGLFEMLELLGRDATLRRMRDAAGKYAL